MTQNGPLGVSFALHVSYTLYIARIVLYRRVVRKMRTIMITVIAPCFTLTLA